MLIISVLCEVRKIQDKFLGKFRRCSACICCAVYADACTARVGYDELAKLIGRQAWIQAANSERCCLEHSGFAFMYLFTFKTKFHKVFISLKIVFLPPVR